MKIVTIIPDFGHRGTQRVAQSFSVEFRRRGHEVAVLPFASGGPRRPTFEAAGIQIFDPTPDLHSAIARVAAWAPDAVHIHRPGLELKPETALLKALRPHVKTIVETNVFARADPTSYGLIDVHFHITRVGLYRWNTLSGAADKPMAAGVYVPNPVDVDAFVRAAPDDIDIHRRERFNAQPGDFVFGRIGKSMHDVFDVFTHIHAKAPQVRLVTIADGEFATAIARQPKAVRDRITILPTTTSDVELRRFYSSIDALLHWSPNGESFGMVLAESIACLTPVVMPLQLHRDIGGIEVLGHMQGGIIAGHGGRLAHAAMDMIRLRREFDAFLPAARERLRSEYAVSTVAQRALDAIELAVATRARGGLIRDAFLADNRFQVTVDRAWFDELLKRREGPTSFRERMLHIATHHPWLWHLPRLVKPTPQA